MLRDKPEALDPDLMIISEEFSEWDESARRIGLLGLDRQGNLVVINRARQVDVADKYGPAEKQSRPLKLNLEFCERQVVNVDTGEMYDVAAAAARIPWVKFLGETVPPTMPAHWYVVLDRCAEVDWNVLAFAIANHPESYLAYFRGYRTPNQYLELADGYRYWRTSLHGTHMLNRCTPDSCEPPRRVDQGARPETDWQGPPWWPKDLPWSEEYQRKLKAEANKLRSR